MPPRAYTGSMGRTERYKRLWAATIRTQPTVAPVARDLTPPARTTKPTLSLQARAEALSCRRSRSGSSLSARTKRPARSDSVCEHRDSQAGGARLIDKKSVNQSWTARQHAASMAAGEAASIASSHSLRTTSAYMRAPSGSARPSRPHSSLRLSFAQHRPPTRCSS